MLFRDIVTFTGTGIIITALLVSLLSINNDFAKNHFKPIQFFILIGLLISINTIQFSHFRIIKSKDTFFIHGILSILQVLLLGIFLLKTIENRKQLVSGELILFATISIELFLVFKNYLMGSLKNTSIYVHHTLGNLALIFLCIQFYKDLFKTKQGVRIINSPTFWVVSGIFFYNTISSPIYGLFNFIPESQGFKSLKWILFQVSNISLIVCYFSIIKAYLCLKHHQNS